MDRGAWRATVHGVIKSQTGLSKNDDSIFRITVLQNTAREQLCFEFNLFFFFLFVHSPPHQILTQGVA